MHLSPRRTLLAALAISLLLHGALLLSTVTPFAVQAWMPAMTVSALLTSERREEIPPLPAARAKSNPPAALPTPKNAAPTLPRQAIVDAPAITVEQASAPSVPSVPAVHVPPVALAARDSGASASSPLPAAASSAATPGKPVPGEALNADDLRQYSLSLGLAARRFKRYPALARERGWEGSAEIELVFDALLSRPEVSLVRSSGRAVLDQQAVEMMTQATRAARLPDGLRGRNFRLLKVVEFSLDGDR